MPQISHAALKVNSSSGDEFLSESWREVLDTCVDETSSTSFLRRMEGLLLSLHLHGSGQGGEMQMRTGMAHVEVTPADSVCRCSVDLLRRHVACECLGLSSPFRFLLKMINDILDLCNNGAHSCSVALSTPMQASLKCILLELYAVEAKLDIVLANAKRKCSLAPQPTSADTTDSSLASFKEKCMKLLDGEDLSTSEGRQSSGSMHVWTAYVDAEIDVGNLSQARKVGNGLAHYGENVLIVYYVNYIVVSV